MNEGPAQTPRLGSDEAGLLRALDGLRRGEVIGIPTETVYGLAADATQGQAVAKIFELKRRPSFNPLIAHACDASMLDGQISWTPVAKLLAARFWPGPLTLVLDRAETCTIHPLASAGLSTQAVRVPNHPLTIRLIERLGVPLAAPSANVSESVSATRAEHVLSSFPQGLWGVIDGGPCQRGLESTVVDARGEVAHLLRPGAVTAEELSESVPLSLVPTVPSPGQQRRHYAPRLPLRINATSVSATESLLAFGKPLPGALFTLNLSPTEDLNEAAQNLFSHLRAFDIDAPPQTTSIAVMKVPTHGLGAAINDRLKRAAAEDSASTIPPP